MALRVLVCGGRDFEDAVLLGSWLGGIHNQQGISCLIHGDAKGADRMARVGSQACGQFFHRPYGRCGHSVARVL